MSSDVDTIVLIDGDTRSLYKPSLFNWRKYPEAWMIDGWPYLYVGTVEGAPHYRRAKPEEIGSR